MEQMKRGRSQVIWRYTPEAIFRYNETGGWCKSTEVTQKSSSSLTGALAKTVAHVLHQWNAIGPTRYPDPLQYPSRYSVGEPYYVKFVLWPLVFACRKCGAVQYYNSPSRLLEVNPTLKCRNCKAQGSLRQVAYAYVCECGNIQNSYIPQHENGHKIVMVNKGSFRESYWYCEDCRRSLQRKPGDGLGFRMCECRMRGGMHGVPLEDSSIYYSQTVDMVDIKPDALGKWQNNPRFNDLLLAAAIRLPAYKPSDIHDLAENRQAESGLSPELRAMQERLIARGMSEEEADAMVQGAASDAMHSPWDKYDRNLNSIKVWCGDHNWQDCRRTVEYIFVRDEPSAYAISLDTLIDEANARGDSPTENRLKAERELAARLGLMDLRIIPSLPILLAGIGYSRYLAGPNDAITTNDDTNSSPGKRVTLRAYPEVSGHKIPIYTVSNTTEAILYELDPWRLAAFLKFNTGVEIPTEVCKSEFLLRAYLLGRAGRLIEAGESHYVLRTVEVENGVTVDDTSSLMFGLLHTISHVMKATAHRYVGVDGDSLAEYLFPAHSAGLLYVSSHVEFTLGGIDSVFRSNLGQWLGAMRDYASRCSFDPVCTQSGGACMACLYHKFGCAYFNRTLSRSFLFGGKVMGRDMPVIGYWTSEVTIEADKLRLSARSHT